jgi:hypothetical protein
MANALIAHVESIFSLGWPTLAVLSLLCAVASYLMKDYLAHPPLALLVFPVMLLLSMVAQYLFMYAELFSPRSIDQWLMWTIFSSTCGSILGIAAVRGLAALRYGAAGQGKAIRPRPKPS